jgi:prepilin-type N-terminal cleavage/methylation domain-containing protein
MKRAGFTIVELLITISIVAIISALLYPLISSAVGRAKEKTCVSNLRQIGMALGMYRADYDGDGRVGTPAQMGMPDWFSVIRRERYYGIGIQFCTEPDSFSGGRGLYGQFWEGFDDKGWAANVEQWGDGTIALFDRNHRNGQRTYTMPFANHFRIGLALGGDVRTRIRKGWPEVQAWWH